MKQIAIVSLHQNLSYYTDMLTSLHCSFRIIRCADGLLPLCDGLLLPGGRDCAPQLYGQKNNGSRSVCLEEDLLQLSAFDCYRRDKRPVLGIGKGMHIINIALGGSIRQHIGHYPHDAISVRSSTRLKDDVQILTQFSCDRAIHSCADGMFRSGTDLSIDRIHHTFLCEGSILEALYGTSLLVNSSHHQALDRIAPGLETIQSAFDGCPEAVQHRSLPIIGVQWHPERLLPKESETDCPPPLADGSLLFRLFLAFI